MSSRPPVLNAAMLEDYEARLRRQGIALDEWARPGLSSGEIEELLAPLGLTLPDEARVWWGWHDGCPGDAKRKLVAPAGLHALSVSEAIGVHRMFREIALRTVEPDIPELADPDKAWQTAWFPLTGPQHPIVVDCSMAAGEPTPLRFVDLENVEGTPQPRADSLGRMISWWMDAIDTGAWRWDAEQGEWKVDRSLMSPECQTNPLV